MKNLAIVLFIFSAFVFKSYGQAENYNLESENLHKKVRKTIEHYYKYDEESGGFVKSSVNIKRFNDDGNLIETYSLYNSKYSESTPVKKLYNYNSDGLLISTKDISDVRGVFSSEYKLTYDRRKNLIKSESIYKDGSKYYTVYTYDKKGRLINTKEYSKDNTLTADTNYTYNGDVKKENKTSFSSKDGSIIGNYITTFNNDVKMHYTSESKYGNSSTTYQYDKQGNLISSNYSGGTNSKTTYDYEYDKKDNWIKKHYRSGKYQYFYFREIHFNNNDITGSVEFDKQFINRLGNFVNVAVVPLKKIEKKKNTIVDNSFTLKNKTWDFNYIYLNKAVQKLLGTIDLKIDNNSNLSLNSNANFTINFKENSYTFNLKVNNYKEIDDKYEWNLANNNNESGTLILFKNAKVLKDPESNKDFFVNGLLTITEKTNSTMSFYLK